jgi:hypothetical protein
MKFKSHVSLDYTFQGTRTFCFSVIPATGKPESYATVTLRDGECERVCVGDALRRRKKALVRLAQRTARKSIPMAL